MADIHWVTAINPCACGLVELLARNGKPLAGVRIGGVNLNAPAQELVTMMPTDRHGMYGRRCPTCKSYFRSSHPWTTFCPYCPATSDALSFFTEDQLAFIERQYAAIGQALLGPDGETTIDFDAQVAEPTSSQTWVYSDEQQQRHFRCPPSCRLQFDVLGDYVRCPSCGRRTAREVIAQKLDGLSKAFESDASTLPSAEREERERRWRQHASSVVAEFDAFGRSVVEALATVPSIPSRKKAIRETSFQGVLDAAEKLQRWFGFDILQGRSEDDRAFVHQMFHRRHLYAHTGGKVDQEYLDKTRDTSVRLHEVIRLRSRDVRRLISLVRTISTSVLDSLDAMQ